jgi:fatty-acyl-CoA synthase
VEAVLGRFPGVASVVVYPVPDTRTGDQVMASLELDAGASFDPVAFGAFLAEQPDLGTKWAPRYVRVVDAIPLTATGKVDRNPLRAQRWSGGEVWWRPGREPEYRKLTADDEHELEQQLAESGRGGALA